MKKTALTFSLAILSVVFLSFNVTNKYYTTECGSITVNGHIKFNIWNVKYGLKYSNNNARKEGIHAVLFTVLTGNNNCITQPPILNSQDERRSFIKIQKQFFANKGEWSNFVNSTSFRVVSDIVSGKPSCKVYEVIVSKDALRKYLEEKKIIKSLNTGF
jgi:hypothetical protein